MQDDIIFRGAKEKTSDVQGPTISGRGRPRAATPRQRPPGRQGPPAQTDGQRREAQEAEQGGGTINPFQQRGNLFGTGDTARARAARRRQRMAARRASRDAAAAPAPAETPAPAPTNRRRLQRKPR